MHALLGNHWLSAALACLLVGLIAAAVPRVTPTARAAAVRYGPNAAQVKASFAAAGWPQQTYNFCGVATIAAVADYGGGSLSQGAVGGYLNSAAARSAWGTPSSAPGYYGPGFSSDISRDIGTDPRSLAQGLTGITGVSYRQIVGLLGAYNATLHLVNDLVSSSVPISVIVLHGQHSVLVTGVYATANPINNLGAVQSLEVADPGFGTSFGTIQSARTVDVSLDTWLNDYRYWGLPYDSNQDGSGEYLDPDPAVGPYNVSLEARAQLWIGHYVYFRQSSAATADWAFSAGGSLIRGVHGEVPSGYSGPTIPMPQAPLPPPPPTPITLSPRAVLTSTPRPTATPSPSFTPAIPTAAPTTGVSVQSQTSGGAFDWKAWCSSGWCSFITVLPDWTPLVFGLLLLGGIVLLALLRHRRRRYKQTAKSMTEPGTAPPPEEPEREAVAVSSAAPDGGQES